MAINLNLDTEISRFAYFKKIRIQMPRIRIRTNPDPYVSASKKLDIRIWLNYILN